MNIKNKDIWPDEECSIMNKAYLLTGGNIGDRRQHLSSAFASINKECGPVVKASAIYETAAWGKNDQPCFLNQVLEIQTSLLPRQLLKVVLAVEKKIGRVRQEKYGPRIIDIDILLYNDKVYQTPSLKIPHPQMQNRRFVLAPLAEIAPDLLHPGFKKTIRELLAICPDDLAVKKI